MPHQTNHVVYGERPLSDIIASLDSGISVNGEGRPASDGERGVLKVSSVSHGRFSPFENKAILTRERDRPTLFAKKGDLLISRANTYELIAACCCVERDYPNLFLPDKLWRVVLRDPCRDDMLWLLQLLNSSEVRREVMARASGTGRNMKNISKEAFLGITVSRPDFVTQRAIAAILGKWDAAIFIIQDLMIAKLRFRQALMQQLLTGEKRLTTGQVTGGAEPRGCGSSEDSLVSLEVELGVTGKSFQEGIPSRSICPHGWSTQ